MQTRNLLDKNIQFLIAMNYQRMVSFEQAAFLTSEASFREFYMQKAEESEINMKQLQLMLPGEEINVSSASIKIDAYASNILHGRKSPVKILEAIKTAEKSIAKWYKTTLKEIKDLPLDMVALVEQQYQSLNRAQLQMEHL